MTEEGSPPERDLASTECLTVGAEDHRLRLDRFLQKARPDLGRNRIDRLLRSGLVWVRGKARDNRYFVKHGDQVKIRTRTTLIPSDPYLILRTSHLVAVAKPPGMTTNPTVHGGSSLSGWLAELVGRPPGILHRLDRDTSGVVLFSLSAEAHESLLAAFRLRQIGKTYLALVSGKMRPRCGTIDLPLSKDRSSGRVFPEAGGQAARTDYRTLRYQGASGSSLLEVHPRTGRMHQIRAHLAAVGHPIAGDPLYGDPRHALGAPRLWLHAERLDIPLELAGRLGSADSIVCPLWNDLVAHLDALGLSRREAPRPQANGA